MTDSEVIEKFIAIATQDDSTEFIVKMIEWNGPSEPYTSDIVASKIEGKLDPDQIQKEKLRIARLRKFFRRCKECGELNPVGWMHDSKICQGCAQENHGVVY